MNHETLVVRASCPLNMYLITPGSAVSRTYAIRITDEIVVITLVLTSISYGNTHQTLKP
ncbi:MAG: hypothetical protein ACKO9X_09920 [Dolichospermum sp.]